MDLPRFLQSLPFLDLALEVAWPQQPQTEGQHFLRAHLSVEPEVGHPAYFTSRNDPGQASIELLLRAVVPSKSSITNNTASSAVTSLSSSSVKSPNLLSTTSPSHHQVQNTAGKSVLYARIDGLTYQIRPEFSVELPPENGKKLPPSMLLLFRHCAFRLYHESLTRDIFSQWRQLLLEWKQASAAMGSPSDAPSSPVGSSVSSPPHHQQHQQQNSSLSSHPNNEEAQPNNTKKSMADAYHSMSRNLTDWDNLVHGKLNNVLTLDSLQSLLNETAEDLAIQNTLQSIMVQRQHAVLQQSLLPWQEGLPESQRDVQRTMEAFIPSRKSKATAAADETLQRLRALQHRQQCLTAQWHECLRTSSGVPVVPNVNNAPPCTATSTTTP